MISWQFLQESCPRNLLAQRNGTGMDRKEIDLAAVEHRETPVVPYHILFLGSLQQRVLDRFGGQDVNRGVGNYINWSLPPNAKAAAVVEESHTNFVDHWGVRWAKNPENRGYVEEHPLSQPDLSRLSTPDPHDPARMAGLAEACERDRDLFKVAWCGDFFERAHFLRGLDALMTDFFDRPRFVHELLDIVLGYNLAVIEELGRYEVDGIILSDDYGHQRGPLISPKHFRMFFRPRLRQIFQAIRKTGKKAFLHSCGDVSAFIPDFIEAGLEVLHPVQPEAMDVFAAKREYGKDLCLYGGVSTQRTLPRGTPDDVRRETRRAMEELAAGGGYILAPALDLPHDTPMENIEAFLEAANTPGGAST